MSRSRTVKKALPLLIGVGLLMSACAAEPGDPGYAYDPYYASLDYDYGGGWAGGWHHGWGPGHGDHGGFADHGGGGDHGGGHAGGGGGHGR